MSVLDQDYPEVDLWDVGPSAEELDEIDQENYVPDPDDIQYENLYDEGYYPREEMSW